jgi:hypothetical protein
LHHSVVVVWSTAVLAQRIGIDAALHTRPSAQTNSRLEGGAFLHQGAKVNNPAGDWHKKEHDNGEFDSDSTVLFGTINTAMNQSGPPRMSQFGSKSEHEDRFSNRTDLHYAWQFLLEHPLMQ